MPLNQDMAITIISLTNPELQDGLFPDSFARARVACFKALYTGPALAPISLPIQAPNYLQGWDDAIWAFP